MLLCMAQHGTYTLSHTHLVLDNPNRRYILKVNDLPKEEKPREKLLSLGPGSLSTQELLAAILNTGTTKEGVLEMSSRIMKEYGEASIMNSKNAASLAQNLSIPIGKAVQIVAVAELGRRFFQRNGTGAAVIRTALDVFEYTKDMRNLPREHLRGLYLNPHYKIIHDETLSIGTIDANMVHPREVFKPALEYSASAVVLVHNHPSGSTEPSQSDIAVTKQLVATSRILSIDLVDHVIVTKDAFVSIPAQYQV